MPRLGLLLDEIPALQIKLRNEATNKTLFPFKRAIFCVNDLTIMYSQNSWSHFVTSNVIPNTPIQINVFQALFPPPPKIQKVKKTWQWTLAVFRVVNKDLMAKLRHKRKPVGCQWRFNSPRNTDTEWSGTGSRKSKLTWYKVWQVMWRARKTPLVDRFIRSKTNITEKCGLAAEWHRRLLDEI